MLLYIHVPFCHHICSYCDFYAFKITKTQNPLITSYTETLHRELIFWSQHLPSQEITTIFFGGGTPSLLSAQQISTILDQVSSLYKISQTPEITIEINPESVNKDKIYAYIKAGINRFSLGVQSFDDSILHSLGRTHTNEQIIQAYKILRDSLCSNIAIDLMWGIPQQTFPIWEHTIHTALTLAPEHISMYNLTIEKRTLLEALHKKNKLILPSEDLQNKMYLFGVHALHEAGIEQYEISNFARDNFQCLHNKGYWDGVPYLGVGPSATSTFMPFRWTNPKSIYKWIASVKNYEQPEKEFLDLKTQQTEKVFLSLRTKKGLNLKDVPFAQNPLQSGKDLQPILASLIDYKLAHIKNHHLQLTPKGFLLANSITQLFL